MAKFKVGDRVRRVAKPAAWAPIGFETTVTQNYGFRGKDGGSYDIFDSKWELIPPTAQAVSGAIRTVTRREIVPGVYGGLEIFEDGSAIVSDWTDPAELREAAHLFNQIAEVLEENAKEAA